VSASICWNYPIFLGFKKCWGEKKFRVYKFLTIFGGRNISGSLIVGGHYIFGVTIFRGSKNVVGEKLL
jgi:hypothetical protein